MALSLISLFVNVSSAMLDDLVKSQKKTFYEFIWAKPAFWSAQTIISDLRG
jgi:hypothetical protein